MVFLDLGSAFGSELGSAVLSADGSGSEVLSGSGSEDTSGSGCGPGSDVGSADGSEAGSEAGSEDGSAVLSGSMYNGGRGLVVQTKRYVTQRDAHSSIHVLPGSVAGSGLVAGSGSALVSGSGSAPGSGSADPTSLPPAAPINGKFLHSAVSRRGRHPRPTQDVPLALRTTSISACSFKMRQYTSSAGDRVFCLYRV